MSAITIERPVAAITVAIATALAILLALFAMGFAVAVANIGAPPTRIDAGGG